MCTLDSHSIILPLNLDLKNILTIKYSLGTCGCCMIKIIVFSITLLRASTWWAQGSSCADLWNKRGWAMPTCCRGSFVPKQETVEVCAAAGQQKAWTAQYYGTLLYIYIYIFPKLIHKNLCSITQILEEKIIRGRIFIFRFFYLFWDLCYYI